MGSLGDVARGLSILKPLRNHFPKARLVWVVEPACAELVKLHPDLDEVLVFDRERWWRGLVELRAAFKQLRPDLVLDLQRHFKSGLVCRLSGAPRRIGFNRKDSKEFNWIFQTEQIEPFGRKESKLIHYHLFLRHIGVPPPSGFDFGYPKAVKTLDQGLLPEKLPERFLVCIVGTKWPSKDWPLENLIELITRLWESDQLPSVLVGTNQQRAASSRIQAEVPTHSIIDLVGRTDLLGLLRVLDRATAGVGGDTGPGHLAAALEIPFLSLFGSTDPTRTAPVGEKAQVLKSDLGCSPCLRRSCPGLDSLCMQSLSPEQVWRWVKRSIGDTHAQID